VGQPALLRLAAELKFGLGANTKSLRRNSLPNSSDDSRPKAQRMPSREQALGIAYAATEPIGKPSANRYRRGGAQRLHRSRAPHIDRAPHRRLEIQPAASRHNTFLIAVAPQWDGQPGAQTASNTGR